MLGTASRICARRSHGHSCKKRIATSKVAPPQFSSESSGAIVCAVAGAASSSSRVRMRVASSDWCASRHVVSVRSSPSCARTALAKPSGPSRSSTCFQPAGGAPAGAAGATGSMTDGGLATMSAPSSGGWPFTLRLAR